MNLQKLLSDLEYDIICGTSDIDVKSITNDSRKTQGGCLYFAIPGAKVDGASFIPDVIRNGAAVIITEKDEEGLTEILEADMAARGDFEGLDDDSVTVVHVDNARYAMGMISSQFYGNPSRELTVIGITGTKGKTTTSYMIWEMLTLAGHNVGLIGTIEIQDGKQSIPAANTTPENIVLHKTFRDMVNNGLDTVVMEVSSQGLMMDRVAGVDFDYGIFTNLSPDHIGPNEHESYEEYRDCKAKLFTLCRTGIFNIDEPESEYMLLNSTCDVYTFGKNPTYKIDEDEFDTNYIASGHQLFSAAGVLGIKFDLQGEIEGEVTVDLPGDFSIHNSLAAIAVADRMGVPFEDIQRILESIKVTGRVEMIPISDEFTLMIDYAHNGMALQSLLEAIREYKPERLVTLFGCGGNRAKSRRYEMGEVSGKYADFTIITSDNPRNEKPEDIIEDIKVGIAKSDGEYVAIVDRKEAVRYAIMNARPGDIIIMAGKGHEDYQEINGKKYHMDERDLIREVLEEEDVTKICGYNNRYFA